MLSTPAEKARLWALVSRRVVTPGGERPAAIVIDGETIAAVVDAAPAGCPVVDVGDHAVLPGLVDTHVHINEPGRTEWEGFETATKAAAAGGITTLVDMPLNSSPVTTSPAAFWQKLAASRGKLWVDCGFYGGIVPGNTSEIDGLIEAGVLGFKAFLCHSGIDDFPAATEADLRAAMPKLRTASLPLLAHAEIVTPLPSEVTRDLAEHPTRYSAYLATRPRAWEHTAIAMLIAMCRGSGGRVHVVHLASADALPMIAAARAEGLPLSIETCPHYLVFASEEIPDADTRFKCAPPIRERENRERLWQAFRDRLIDTVGSDHSPAPPGLKHLDTGNLERAWGGIASLQVSLSAMWTAASERGFTLSDLTAWMSERPAKLVGLTHRKGVIAAGFDADLVVFDPEVNWSVDAAKLYHRHKATPYDGRTLRGRVETTYVRGQRVFAEGRVDDVARGRTLLRQAVDRFAFGD